MSPTGKVAVVTDSTCDLPPDLLEENRIYQIPAILVINGQEYEDGPDISRELFYEQLPTMTTLPTTAAPSSGSFTRLYSQLFDRGYTHVIAIHVASELSGIYNASRIAARDFPGQVHVVDSGQVSMGLGFQVLAAAHAAARQASIKTIIAHIHDVRRRIRVVAMLDTLEYLRRSGRVSWGQVHLGSMLRIKIFVELIDGVVKRIGETRTRRKGISRLLDLYYQFQPVEHIAILHTNAIHDAQLIQAKLNHGVKSRVRLINVSTVIGAHIGPKGLGFAAVLQHS